MIAATNEGAPCPRARRWSIPHRRIALNRAPNTRRACQRDGRCWPRPRCCRSRERQARERWRAAPECPGGRLPVILPNRSSLGRGFSSPRGRGRGRGFGRSADPARSGHPRRQGLRMRRLYRSPIGRRLRRRPMPLHEPSVPGRRPRSRVYRRRRRRRSFIGVCSRPSTHTVAKPMRAGPSRSFPTAKRTGLSRAWKTALCSSRGRAAPFFETLLQDTRYGFFADPIFGGNRDMAAWKMTGFPGARYDYRDWVERHNERYPHPAGQHCRTQCMVPTSTVTVVSNQE